MSIKETFFAVNKNYLNQGLKSIDILILSQIEEFDRNKCKCYVTNKQFADMFGESESTIKRALERLETQNILKRDVVGGIQVVTIGTQGRSDNLVSHNQFPLFLLSAITGSSPALATLCQCKHWLSLVGAYAPPSVSVE